MPMAAAPGTPPPMARLPALARISLIGCLTSFGSGLPMVDGADNRWARPQDGDDSEQRCAGTAVVLQVCLYTRGGCGNGAWLAAGVRVQCWWLSALWRVLTADVARDALPEARPKFIHRVHTFYLACGLRKRALVMGSGWQGQLHVTSRRRFCGACHPSRRLRLQMELHRRRMPRSVPQAEQTPKIHGQWRRYA